MKRLYSIFLALIFLTVGMADLFAQCPTITCPANMTVNASSGSCGANVSYSAPVGTNPCGAANTVTFSYTGAQQSFTVPSGVTAITVVANGAQGGGTVGGLGGRATATIPVTPGEVLQVWVGGQPTAQIGIGGFNGGGGNTIDPCAGSGGYPGGGGSDIRRGSGYANRLIAAGGGGGQGWSTGAGGAGGGTTGTDGAPSWIAGTNGKAGSSSAGGLGGLYSGNGQSAPSGALGQGGDSGPINTYCSGGGGGGGYYGGGGGYVSAGGGGSSYAAFPGNTVTSTLANVRSGNGIITITYNGGGSASTSLTTGPASGANFNVGTTAVVYTVNDGVGNTASCSFSVTVNDLQAPVLTCPANVTAFSSSNSCDASVNYTAPVATDNCPSPTTTQSVGLPSGATFPMGITTNSYLATDAAGNTSSCTFTVSVSDNLPPVANCQSAIVTLNALGNGSITTNDIDNGSTDNCAVASTSLNNTTFTCANVGANTVILTVTDGSGNTATCSAIVTVASQAITSVLSAPTTTCGFNLTCAGANNGTASVTASGGCPGISYLWSNGNTTSTIIGLSAGIYYVTITDGAGATTLDSVVITAPAPLQVAQNAITSTCTGDSTGAIDISVSGGNVCTSGYTYLWSNGATTEDISNLGAGIYIVTVTDLQGCNSIQTVIVPSFAVPNPAISLAGNTLSAVLTWSSYQWLLNGSPISGANASTYVATVSGNYSLVVTDANGCEGTSQPTNVTVVGIAAPTAQLLALSLYPNPTRSSFQLRTAVPIGYALDVRIMDIYGHVLGLRSLPELSRDAAFDIQGFAAGTYLIEVVTELGEKRVMRLVVQ